jgi:hypothetical protein
MTAVIWALTICLGFGVALILAIVRTNQVGAATLRELSRRAELADQFRADVAAADAAPDRVGPWTSGPDCLILHTPVNGHVVYRWQDGGLQRVVKSGDTERRTPFAVGPEGTAVEFARGAGDPPLLTMTLIEHPVRGVARRVDVSAALGGDTR